MFILKSNTLRMTAQNHFCQASGNSIFCGTFQIFSMYIKGQLTALYNGWLLPYLNLITKGNSCTDINKLRQSAKNISLFWRICHHWHHFGRRCLIEGVCTLPTGQTLPDQNATRPMHSTCNCHGYNFCKTTPYLFTIITLVAAWVALASSYAKFHWLRICPIKWTSKGYMWKQSWNWRRHCVPGTSLCNTQFIGMHHHH